MYEPGTRSPCMCAPGAIRSGPRQPLLQFAEPAENDTDLAFDDPALRQQAVVGVLTGSLLAAALGWTVFRVLGERGGVCAPPGEDTDPVPTLPPRPWYEPAR